MSGISSAVPPIKFDSAGNVLANINAQNINPNANAVNIKTDANGNVLANINAQNINPNVNQPPIWSYLRPSYTQANVGSSNTLSAANTIVSTGKGISIVSLTGNVFLKVLINTEGSSTSYTYTVYVYRSTVGIPVAGGAPNTGDTQLVSWSGSNNTEVDREFHYLDTVAQGSTVYYYIAVAVNNPLNTVSISGITSSGGTIIPIGIMGTAYYPLMEAICI